MKQFHITVVAVIVSIAASGCSGKSKKGTTPEPRNEPRPESRTEPSGEPEARPDEPARPREMQVKGLLGTIDEEAVAKAFRLKRYQIEQCILGPARAMTYITGTMHFKFEIGVDGAVKIKVLANDVGHHAIEDCILKVAQSLTFGKPKGGKVIINYPLRIPDRGTPHITWTKSRVRSVMKGRRSAVRACRKSGRPRRFTLHFYVLPGGRVIALGVHAKGKVPSGFAACVLAALKQVTFPDPLGKVAKVAYSF